MSTIHGLLSGILMPYLVTMKNKVARGMEKDIASYFRIFVTIIASRILVFKGQNLHGIEVKFF